MDNWVTLPENLFSLKFISPTILFYRMLLSAAIMAAVALLLKRNFRISRRDFGVLAGLSLMYTNIPHVRKLLLPDGG